ncbi:MAG: TonB-dependent receptor [Bacteroidota bacterium]
MKKLKLITAISFTFLNTVFSQETGTIKGTLNDEKGKTMPFVTVVLMEDSTTIVETANTNDDGDFTFKKLTPGFYELQFSFLGYSKKKIRGIEVTANQTSYVYKTLKPESEVLEIVEVSTDSWEKPVINSTYSTMTNITIGQIEKTPAPKGDIVAILIAVTPGVLSTADGKDIYLRGSRRGSTAYYIDGNRVIGSPDVPGLGISGMEVLTGGVPAEYGDCTGGLVIITTKDYKTEMRRKRIKETAREESKLSKNAVIDTKEE